MYSRLSAQITTGFQQIDEHLTTGFRTFGDRFRVLEAKVKQVNLNVESCLHFVEPDEEEEDED
jgi:hypothetical protein